MCIVHLYIYNLLNNLDLGCIPVVCIFYLRIDLYYYILSIGHNIILNQHSLQPQHICHSSSWISMHNPHDGRNSMADIFYLCIEHYLHGIECIGHNRHLRLLSGSLLCTFDCGTGTRVSIKSLDYISIEHIFSQRIEDQRHINSRGHNIDQYC